MWRRGKRMKYFLTSSKLRESYEESANAANSWLHLHNTHQASLSLQQPVNSHMHTNDAVPGISTYIFIGPSYLLQTPSHRISYVNPDLLCGSVKAF